MAGMLKNISDYKWSSFNVYVSKGVRIDKEYALNTFSENKEISIEAFVTIRVLGTGLVNYIIINKKIFKKMPSYC